MKFAQGQIRKFNDVNSLRIIKPGQIVSVFGTHRLCGRGAGDFEITEIEAKVADLKFTITTRVVMCVDIGHQRLTINFGITLPVQLSLVGDNNFTLRAMDVTPAPYNQPPYAPSGALDSDLCTVVGLKP